MGDRPGTSWAAAPCDTPANGYQCFTGKSHLWGQYSPYYSVPSAISTDVPKGCDITLVNVLHRHGSRFPTASKSATYASLISTIHNKTKSYSKDYQFIQNYTYTLGSDSLTAFGQQEMYNSGVKFYNQYKSLARKNVPFLRTDSSARVIQSAVNFTQGFYDTCEADPKCSIASYFPNFDGPSVGEYVVLTASATLNDTLDPGNCYNYASGYYSKTQGLALAAWANVFASPIQTRVNQNLVGANLTTTQVIYLMDLCAFNTVASPGGATLSPFCGLFTQAEFEQYNYYGMCQAFAHVQTLLTHSA